MLESAEVLVALEETWVELASEAVESEVALEEVDSELASKAEVLLEEELDS